MGKEKTTGTTVVNQTTTPTPTAEETALNQLQLQQAQVAQPYVLQTQGNSYNLINKLLTGSSDLPGFFGDIYSGINSNGQMTSPGDINAAQYQQELPRGLDASQYTIGESQISDITSRALQDLAPQFQSSGILDSGTAAAIAGRTAGNIRRSALERNLDTRLGVDQSNLANRQAIQQANIERALSIEDQNKSQNLGIQEYNLNQQFSKQGFNIGNLLNLLNLAVGGQAQVQQPTLATSQMLGGRLAGLRSINTQGTTSTTTQSMNPFIKSFQTSAGQGLGNWFDPNSYANLMGAMK